jgi:hypothetical protein
LQLVLHLLQASLHPDVLPTCRQLPLDAQLIAEKDLSKLFQPSQPLVQPYCGSRVRNSTNSSSTHDQLTAR